jgi:hypothetical protein
MHFTLNGTLAPPKVLTNKNKHNIACPEKKKKKKPVASLVTSTKYLKS